MKLDLTQKWKNIIFKNISGPDDGTTNKKKDEKRAFQWIEFNFEASSLFFLNHP
jgi:hypothetical protein